MNKRLLSYATLVLGMLLLVWWLFRGNVRHLNPAWSPLAIATNTIDQPSSINVMSVTTSKVVTTNVVHTQAPIGLQSIRLFKSTNYPPQTPEEKAMWKWWDAMGKADPQFEGKMPIEFYGKVIDQFGQPVVQAEVELNWTTAVGPVTEPKKRVFTGLDGRFEVNGIQGSGITISVSKNGYESGSDWIQNFEYAAFYQDNFHVPDPKNPVLFHLHKLMGAEPMYQYQANGEITFDGRPVILDVATGKLAESGDFTFSLRLDGRSERGPDYTLLLQAQNDAGFILTNERFPFNAPENGYQTTMLIRQKVDDTNYNSRQTFHFYAKTHEGKYGVVWFEVNVPGVGETASCNATIRFNPSGSRNLEFDQNKWINR